MKHTRGKLGAIKTEEPEILTGIFCFYPIHASF
jgi:hypothetical protein